MRGDALASGARSASFSVAPGLKFDEGQMRDDLAKLVSDDFIEKYMITRREYDMMLAAGDEDKVSSFAEEMKQRAAFNEAELARDAKQDASLDRTCFLTPFTPVDITGRVIVARDRVPEKGSSIVLPRSYRKDKVLLPTTGHVIKESLYTEGPLGTKAPTLIGKRILFSPMSGTAICFKGYPTWIQLELSEILAIVDREDVDLIEEELEPMV